MDLQQIMEEAVLWVNTGRTEEAAVACERALLACPGHIGCMNLLGIAYRGSGHLVKSIQTHQRAVELSPDVAESHLYLGESLLLAQRVPEAVDCFQQAVRIRPNLAQAWSSLGYGQTLRKDYAGAILSLKRAGTLEPQNPDILNRLGLAFRGAKQIPAAIEHYQQALRLRPKFAQALNNLGAAYQLQLDFTKALQAYEQALKIQPEYLAVWNNLGALFQAQHLLPEAIQAYQKAQSIDPKYFPAHVNEGHARLLKGDFALGWLKHEYRWLAIRTNPQRSFTQPLWRGEESLLGKTILLHSEQGFGDSIQFIRYATLLKNLGATVHVEIQPALTQLAETVPGVSSVSAYGTSLPPFDFHCPLMSLPLAFKTTLESIPNQTPYFFVPESARLKWAGTIPKTARPRVGLVWRGSATHENDALRSISFETIQPLLDSTHVDFVNLQLGLSDAEANAFLRRSNWQDPTAHIASYTDTAALISQLDLVISVDTSVAHLAGALGKAVWLLLPFSPDWRWLLNREDSPWYPFARLFRQPSPQAWGPVIGAVLESLNFLR